MAEVPGVVNLHLRVDFDPPNNDATEPAGSGRMTMLYQIAEGPVAAAPYGLELAKVVELPPSVIETAQRVSKVLTEKNERRRRVSRAVIDARRRKLIFALRETLQQARDGKMEGDALWAWLKRLQEEFIVRMAKLDEEANGVVSDDEDEEVVLDGDDEFTQVSERE